MEEERRLAYVGMTRARQRLYLSHAWQRATRGTGQLDGRAVAVPAGDPGRAHERPAPRRVSPRMATSRDAGRPEPRLRYEGRRASGAPIRPAAGAFREGSGRPGGPRPGEAFRPTRDLAAKREAFAGGARSGTFGRRRVEAWDDAGTATPRTTDAKSGARGATARRREAPSTRPVIPGERRYRDGDRVRHARWGDGIVVSSKLTRSDEEVTVAFRDPQIGRKTLLASLAGLELTG